MSEKILIIEDEPGIRNILSELLSESGYAVRCAVDGEEGIDVFRKFVPDLILLDIMMPKLDGYEVLRIIREEHDTPVIMLTALGSEHAQVKAFEMQVDDYITKPFSLRLVLLRVEAVLRRMRDAREVHGDVTQYICRGITMRPDVMRVFKGEEEISLTRLEYSILKLFMESPGKVFTRDNLLRLVWGYDFAGDDKAVNIHIMNIRKKLDTEIIETVRGVGYRLVEDQ